MTETFNHSHQSIGSMKARRSHRGQDSRGALLRQRGIPVATNSQGPGDKGIRWRRGSWAVAVRGTTSRSLSSPNENNTQQDGLKSIVLFFSGEVPGVRGDLCVLPLHSWTRTVAGWRKRQCSWKFRMLSPSAGLPPSLCGVSSGWCAGHLGHDVATNTTGQLHGAPWWPKELLQPHRLG